jgi:hypothetical protein
MEHQEFGMSWLGTLDPGEILQVVTEPAILAGKP